MIELKNIFYSYSANSSENTVALKDINLKINKGEFIGIAGHTGSGKTTVAQILAGLINPSEGEIVVNGESFSDYKSAARALRQKVGIVFQYPEHQLFEETVYRDIAFGPKNKGLNEKEVDECVRKSASLAHLKEELFDKSPFELSGGQKRRVAIAGVLATEPEVLILDEPAAGLDPSGRARLLEELRRIREEGTTVILISHSMEDLAENVDRIILLGNGEKIKDASTSEVFQDVQSLENCSLEIPEITKIIKILNENGMNIPENIFTVEDACDAICKALEVSQ
ncbi:MAG: energy-coupling factor transporter ATPase [Clostridia bacterium]|nr:energy-coupling factor transporter ATPase [Clostridia bacterium]